MGNGRYLPLRSSRSPESGLLTARMRLGFEISILSLSVWR